MVNILTFFVSLQPKDKQKKNGNVIQKAPDSDFAGKHGHRPRDDSHHIVGEAIGGHPRLTRRRQNHTDATIYQEKLWHQTW